MLLLTFTAVVHKEAQMTFSSNQIAQHYETLPAARRDCKWLPLIQVGRLAGYTPINTRLLHAGHWEIFVHAVSCS